MKQNKLIKCKEDCGKILNFLTNYSILHSTIICDSKVLFIEFDNNNKRVYKVYDCIGLPFKKELKIIISTTDVDQALLILNPSYIAIKKIQDRLL